MPRALITGPTSGIGNAFARALAEEGYDLVLVARDEVRLNDQADDLSKRHHIECEVLVADLADHDQCRAVEARLEREPFDMLVNNAGFGLTTSFDEADVEDEQRSLDVLVRAVMRLTHAALGPMLDAGRGDVINVSSVAGYLPRGTYAASKAWVTSFSSWAGIRYRSQGVRVMALAPGFVHTEFHQRMDADMSDVGNWMWLDADYLVRIALKDLRAGKSVSIPSVRYKVLTALTRATPQRLVERVARRGRTPKQKSR